MGKNKALVACAILVGCLCAATVWAGDETTEPESEQAATENPAGDKELLLFYEEQDLVTATKRPVSLRKAPAIATIITADEIRNMGARNLLDVLKMVPGFGVSMNEIGLAMVEVRGVRSFLSEKILVMVDGHSLNNNLTGSAFFNYADLIPMENVKQVEVVRGPGSALYGNSAFVATINVITRNAEEINGLEVKGGGGSFNTWKGNLVGGKAFGDKLTVSGSLDHTQTDGPRLTVPIDSLSGTTFSMAPGAPEQGARQTDAFLKIGYGDLSLRGGYTGTRKHSFLGFGFAVTDNNFTDHQSYWSELAYAHTIGEGLTVNGKFRFDQYHQDPNVKIYPDGFSLAPGVVWPSGMIGKPFVTDRTLGGELQLDWDAFKGNHLIGGVSFDTMRQLDVKQQANFDPLTYASLPTIQDVANWNKDATRQIVALYLQDEWQLLESVNLTYGVRYDHYSDFGDTVNHRVGLVWSFLENAELKFLYGQAFRAPNFEELYNINNPALLGNPNLKPEKIETYETGVGYRLSRFLGANLNYFYSTIEDQIDVNGAAVPVPTYANIGKTVTQGVELGLNGAIGTDLDWKAAYTYQDPRDAVTDRRLPYVPSHRASGSVNYALTRYANLHADLLWTGPRPRVQGDARPETPDYTTADLALTLKNFYKTLEIQAAVHNLLDQRYKDPDTSGAAQKIPGDFPREGISWLLTASCKF